MSDQSSDATRVAGDLSPPLERNIQALLDRRRKQQCDAPLQDRIAAAISRFAGSMLFVYIHLVIFGGWILINTGWLPLLPAWDPTLVVLAMVASVEAIFLSTFVLINQNRMATIDMERAELDLQMTLLNEHETTRLVKLVDAIAQHLKVDTGNIRLEELEQEVSPEAVLERLDHCED